jgi:NitT/TauT family transport system ATP-binding protein
MNTIAGPGNRTMASAIIIQNLSMSFSGRHGVDPVHVLDGIDLKVAQGEFVCLVGPSGCGKSTILNILGGFLEPTHGEVLVGGEPVRGPDPRRIFIFQENGIFPWLTVWDNIGFGLLRMPLAKRNSIVKRYIEMVGLAGFEQAYSRELSGGMRQRVELARALAADPQIIYMDEPFGALDYLTRLKMRADLTGIWQAEHKTIVFVTHDIDEAVQLADRVVVFSPRPASVRAIIPINVPRPRHLEAGEYLEARKQIFAAMNLNSLL